MKKFVKVLAVMGMIGLSSAPSYAQGLNTVTTNLSGQMTGVVNVISAISYILGVALGVKAALKMKESNETKGQVPISNAIVLALVAGVLLALPTFLKTGKETIFGGGATSTDLSGSSLHSIQ